MDELRERRRPMVWIMYTMVWKEGRVRESEGVGRERWMRCCIDG
jgi:hypothetical protein